jgi:hypothetical protein
MICGGGYENDEDARRALIELQRGDIRLSARRGRSIPLDIEKVIQV